MASFFLTISTINLPNHPQNQYQTMVVKADSIAAIKKTSKLDRAGIIDDKSHTIGKTGMSKNIPLLTKIGITTQSMLKIISKIAIKNGQ